MRLEGPGSAPKQISVTGRGTRDVVYDASLGIERRLKRGLFWCYALDAKGRGGWQPWLRQGLGLKCLNGGFRRSEMMECASGWSLLEMFMDFGPLLAFRLQFW